MYWQLDGVSIHRSSIPPTLEAWMLWLELQLLPLDLLCLERRGSPHKELSHSQMPCKIPWARRCQWHRCQWWMVDLVLLQDLTCQVLDHQEDYHKVHQHFLSLVVPQPSQISLVEVGLLQAHLPSQIWLEVETWGWWKQDHHNHQIRPLVAWARVQTLEKVGCSPQRKHPTGGMASGMMAKDLEMVRAGVVMAGVVMAGVMVEKVLAQALAMEAKALMAKDGVAKDGMVARVGVVERVGVGKDGTVGRDGMEAKALETKDLAKASEEKMAVAKALHHTERSPPTVVACCHPVNLRGLVLKPHMFGDTFEVCVLLCLGFPQIVTGLPAVRDNQTGKACPTIWQSNVSASLEASRNAHSGMKHQWMHIAVKWYARLTQTTTNRVSE